MRKRYFGDVRAAQEYTRDAAKLLEQVKHQMTFAGLKQLSRRVDLPNGVILAASVVPGQEEIRVFAPSGGGEVLVPVEASRVQVYFAAGGGESSPSTAPVWQSRTGAPVRLPSGGTVYAVSKGGAVVAGDSSNRATIWEGFGGAVDLGAGASSRAFGVSWDGRVVTGDRVGGAWYIPLLWVRGQGTVTVPVPATSAAGFYGVSRDGTFACGNYRVTAFSTQPQPVLYDVTSQSFTFLSTPHSGHAYGVSADGRVVCGEIVNGPSQTARACVWIDGTRTTISNAEDSIAFSVSHDGRVVVGQDAADYVAWYWTQEKGKVVLGDGLAYGVSEFGNVVVGEVDRGGLSAASFWDLGTGASGVFSSNTATFSTAYAVSACTDFVTERPGEPPQMRTA